MNIQYSLMSAALLLMAGGTVLTGCNAEGDDYDYCKNGLLVVGTEVTPVQKFVVEDTPSSYPISIQATSKVESDVKVSLAIDTALVSQYNLKNGSSYYGIPLDCVELENSEVTIKAGSAVSTATAVKVVSTESFVEGRSYMIPVTIKAVSGGNLDVVEASRTLFIRISRVLNFHHMSYTSTASSNFIFDESKKVDLGNYTIQFKFYANGFGYAGNIQRVLAIEGANEEMANMFRFGESGSAGGDILQWIYPGGGMFSTTHFAARRWYLVTCTYNGSDFNMYVDDNPSPDANASVSGKSTPFQRFELGMSWGNYYASQYFSGRLAEIRLWNKALSPSTIATTLCGVDPNSDGLVAYWKMNQTEGYVIKDVSNHGYDMDWKNTVRDKNESGNLSATTDAYQGISWGIDENNKCSE